MSYWPEITKIIEGGVQRNVDKVINYSRLLTQKLEADGNKQIAKRILSLIEGSVPTSSVRPSSLASGQQVPFDQDSRLPIADVYHPNSLHVDIVLSPELEATVDRIVTEYRHAGKLLEAGLELPSTILLFGPPGCGKSLLAKYIAAQLNLPLVVSRLDAIVSSYLGSTAKNLRMLFEYAQRTPCVLFLDEFDAIAKIRDDTQELGELKRVVNSLLQNIDSLGSEHVLIAATNHAHILDRAVWRRFSWSLELSLPGDVERARLINLFLRTNRISDSDLGILVRLFRGLSGSTIETICTQALRESLLFPDESSLIVKIGRAFFRQVQIDNVTGNPDVDRVLYLRNLDESFFSFATIGRLLGYSKQWAQKLYQKGIDQIARR